MKRCRSRSMVLVICLGFTLSSAVFADPPIPDLPTINEALTLKDALAQAMTNNLSLKQAQADAGVAAAMARSSAAQTKPSVATTTYALVGDSSNIVASSPGVMPQNYFGAPPRGVLDQNVIVMAPLFTGGKLTGQVTASQAQSQAANLSLDQAKLVVQEAVTEAYTKVLLQGALLDVAQSRLTAEDEQVRVTQEKVRVGRSAPVDLLREQAEQADARQSVLEARNNQSQALIDLKAALGISQTSEITLTDSLDALSLPATLPASLKEALRQADALRPDLAAMLRQVAAARANVQSARGAYAPQIYAMGMADATAVTSGGSRAGYTVGLTASLQLYDGGQRRADVDAAKARLDRAVADAQSVRQAVDQQVASAWLNLQTATAKVESATLGVSHAQKAYDLANLRYNAGKSVAAERLDSLAALTRAQGAVVEAKAAVLIAYARSQRAIGIQR